MASSKTAKKRSKVPAKKKRSAANLKGKRAPRCVSTLEEEPPETEGGGGPGEPDNPNPGP